MMSNLVEETKDYLDDRLFACYTASKYVKENDWDIRKVWNECPYTGWMLWLAAELEVDWRLLAEFVLARRRSNRRNEQTEMIEKLVEATSRQDIITKLDLEKFTNIRTGIIFSISYHPSYNNGFDFPLASQKDANAIRRLLAEKGIDVPGIFEMCAIHWSHNPTFLLLDYINNPRTT